MRDARSLEGSVHKDPRRCPAPTCTGMLGKARRHGLVRPPASLRHGRARFQRDQRRQRATTAAEAYAPVRRLAAATSGVPSHDLADPAG